MKKGAIFFICLLIAMGFAVKADAVPLFFDDFEDGNLFDSWVDDGNTSSTGQIVDDPLQDNHALNFTGTDTGGDIFTTSNVFTSQTGQFKVSFDYLGLETEGDDDTDDLLGGFIGYSYGYPGTHYWLAGTNVSYTNDIGQVIYENGVLKTNRQLLDTGVWIRYDIYFSATPNTSIHIMLEDFHLDNGSMGTGYGGDAYFDNIALSAIPEPPTLLLLGVGFMFVAGLGRRRLLKKK